MDTGKKRNIVRLLFLLWIAIWLLFIIRPFFKKDLLNEYMTLASLSAEEKRSRITGEELYEFIKFCNNSVPSPADYELIGIETDSIEYRRSVYYLYPNAPGEDAQFLFIYKVPGFGRGGYAVFKSQDADRYILKKISG